MKRSLALIACLLALFCITVQPVLAEEKVISVSQFVEHPSLDAALQGAKDYFAENGLAVEFKVHNAQANMATTVQIAAQILGEQPDLVLAIATPSAQACAQKIRTIPVLATAVTDFVSAGLVDSIEHPGGNVSGATDMVPVENQLALVREIHPELTTLGIIYNAGEANSVVQANMMREACKAAGITLEEATVLNTAGVYQAAKSLVGRADAVYLPTDNTVVAAMEGVVKVCEQNRLPLYAADNNSVERGAVAALALDYYQLGRQTGAMAKRILFDGADISTMPVENLKNLAVNVNLKAAKAMGVTLPDSVMNRAERVFK